MTLLIIDSGRFSRINARIDDVLAVVREIVAESAEIKHSDPFRVLIGCILSQRTRDTNSEKACENLFSIAQTPGQIIELDMSSIHESIKCSGFYNQKSKYILETCRQIVAIHDGKVPRTRKELLTLYGVGHKTADIVLSYGFGEPTIPVDVHVSRVSKRLGFATPKDHPEDVKEKLEKIIVPRDRMLYDHGALKIGKAYCRKSDPKCPECPLDNICEKNIV